MKTWLLTLTAAMFFFSSLVQAEDLAKIERKTTTSEPSGQLWKKWKVTSAEEEGKSFLDGRFSALDQVKKVNGKWIFLNDEEPKIMGPKKLELVGVKINIIRAKAVAPQLSPDKTSKWIMMIVEYEAQTEVNIFGKGRKLAVRIERYVKTELNAAEGEKVPRVVALPLADKSAELHPALQKDAAASQDSEVAWKKWKVSSREKMPKSFGDWFSQALADKGFVALDEVKKVKDKWVFVDKKAPMIEGPKQVKFFGVTLGVLDMRTGKPQLTPDMTSKWVSVAIKYELKGDKFSLGFWARVGAKLNAAEGVVVNEPP
jgi:hypothetical protein